MCDLKKQFVAKQVFVYGLMVLFSFSVSAVPTDYFVLGWSETDGLKVHSYQVVDLPEPQKVQINPPSHSSYVSLVDTEDGGTTYVSLKQATFTRSEHHGHDHIDGQMIRNEEEVFVIRVPSDESVILSVHDQNNHKISAGYLLKDLIGQANFFGKTEYSKQGSEHDNRVNLLIMGDGYTSTQENDFNADADIVVAQMEDIEPYSSYGSFISYDKLFTVSNDSGADHPVDPCGDGVADPQAPLFVDTAFDATFCTANIHRLLSVNSSKVYTAAAASPNWDVIVVIVNDATYGGSGGPFSTISTNLLAADVFIHEYGHSFTGLADEYDTPFPAFPDCSDTGIIGLNDCEANATDETDEALVKWNYFFENSTPIPTPETSTYNGVVGLFEGARYQATGMYRPKNMCNMQTLGAEFCEVCQEAYVLELYSGDYAENGSVISLIENGSKMPAGINHTGVVSMPMTFAVDVLPPTHGVTVRWLVDDVEVLSNVSSDINQSFEFTPSAAGTVSIKVRVKDISPMVHSSRLNELPFYGTEWLVDVEPLDDLIFQNGFE